VTIDPGAALAWIALAAAVVMGAKGTLQRTTITALKEQNEAFSAREEQHQKDLKRERDERAEKDLRTDAALKRLGDRNTYLEELVLRRAEGQEIVNALQAHDSEAAARHAATIKALREIRHAQAERAETEARLLAVLTEKAKPDAD
jgi:hypothetical protein